MQQHDQMCPWCQTEIIWDPEIGPEEVCPHCLNELGDYRSVPLTAPTGEQLIFDEEDEHEEYEDIEATDEYEEGVHRVMDTQEEVPECSSCQSLMLLAGNRTMALGFVPFVSPLLKQPLLKAAHSMKVFVCPACFKVDHILADEDRTAMVEQLKTLGSK